MTSRLHARSLAPLAILLASACGGTTGEPTGASAGRSQLLVVAGGDLSDTVDARPVQALVVEVRSDGRVVAGVPVRFASVTTATDPSVGTTRVTAGSIDGRFLNLYFNLPSFVDTTDANGRARALLAFGTTAGTAKISVAATAFGAEMSATVSYVVRPGAASRLTLGVRDTTLFSGDSYSAGAGAVDRYGNMRADQLTFSAVDELAIVEPTGRILVGNTTGRGRVAVRLGSLTDTARYAVLPRAPITFVSRPLEAPPAVAIGNLDGSGTSRLDALSVLTSAYPTLPASGTPLVYHVIVLNGTPYGIGSIFIRDGSTPARLLLPEGVMYSASYPRITRDGEYVYFAGAQTDTSATAIWRVRPDGSQLERITSPATSNSVQTQPALSPDGTRLAYSDRSAGTVTVMTLATGASYSIGDDGGMVPAFSPDGSKLVYLSWRSGVVVVNVDGSNAKTVGDGWWGAPTVSWLRDGQWLLLPDAGTVKVINATSGERIYVPRTTFMYEPSARP